MMHVPGDAASPWIVRFAPLVRPGSRVLDLAAGAGRHARYLAARGAQVLAVDRDAALLARLDGTPGITCRCIDLEGAAWPLAAESFDAIVVVNYLHRPRRRALMDLLAPSGLLLYETFAEGNEAYGRPSNPDFLLRRGELLEWAAEGQLTVVAFEQGRVTRGAHEAVVQRLAAQSPAAAWPPSLC